MTKLTPAMRRVLERMARGCVVVYNTRTGRIVWGDNGNVVSFSDVRVIRGGRGKRLFGRDRKGWLGELWVYRITPTGRKALEE